MATGLPNKRALSEMSRGPAWVQTIAGVETLGIGRGASALYGRWFAFQQERRRQQQDAPAVKAFRSAPPVLTGAQRQVVDALVDCGIAHVDMKALVPADWGERLGAEVEAWIGSPEIAAAEHAYRTSTEKRWKDYLVRKFGRGAVIPFESPWLQFGIQPGILDIVNSYLGMLSKMLYIDVWDTVPLVHDGPDTGSQRWHRDPEDAKLVKVFLYFSDVDADAGAMEYVPYSRRGDKYGNLWPQQFPKGSVPPPDEFERKIPRSAWTMCTQPAGTLIFVDTSGFHRGGRALTRRRILATWTYTRQSSVWPRAFEPVGIPASPPPPVHFAISS